MPFSDPKPPPATLTLSDRKFLLSRSTKQEVATTWEVAAVTLSTVSSVLRGVGRPEYCIVVQEVQRRP